MRWKIILAVSVIASLVGSAGLLGGVYLLTDRLTVDALEQRRALFALFFLLPLVFFAALFVYRHTARRRRTQSIITVIFTLLLTLALTTGFLMSR